MRKTYDCPCVATPGPTGSSLGYEDNREVLHNLVVECNMVTTNGTIPASLSRTLFQRQNIDNTDTSNSQTHPTAIHSSFNSLRDVEPIVFAIQRGDAQAVNELSVAAPLSLVKENKDGWIPLHEAAYYGQAECIKALMKAYAYISPPAQPGSVDKRTLQEQTALLLSVSGQHLSCVQCLLQAGADPDISCKNKETPLYKACERENVEIVSLILSFGATVNQRCNRGWTALHEAVCRDNMEICEMLVRAGATINPPNTYSITPLIVAVQQGRVEALRYLIRKGADVNMQTCDGATALYEASRDGHREIVELLLSHNTDANKPTKTGLLPLHIAAQYGHHEIVSLLVPVTSRARVRHSGISPLHLAAEHNRDMVTAILLKTGANVNATLSHNRSMRYSDHRTTPLYFAIANGSSKTVEMLLKAGANLSLDPVNPLLAAVRHGCARTVSLLLEHGADINTSVPACPTTFPGAIVLCMNNLPLLKCLLDKGCDAQACFRCAYGCGPHPAQDSMSSIGVDISKCTNDMSLLTCTEPAVSKVQFCELISSSSMCNWEGPIVDLLLDYVGNVQLCARLTEVLRGRREWPSIKAKSLSSRPLMHLCRLRIREQVGVSRLRSLDRLPLPDRLLQYLSLPRHSFDDFCPDGK
ncbi:ankyrin repeat and SOCS box protein 2-like isoform X2 [Salvelinus alpinus]|uniref:ankyrin repeat and SOCS box protein 2-like isoform X2 n=1 Tax=Salvelinus alpinus TaxID=8036 RepID=UPI0039FBA0A5